MYCRYPFLQLLDLTLYTCSTKSYILWMQRTQQNVHWFSHREDHSNLPQPFCSPATCTADNLLLQIHVHAVPKVLFFGYPKSSWSMSALALSYILVSWHHEDNFNWPELLCSLTAGSSAGHLSYMQYPKSYSLDAKNIIECSLIVRIIPVDLSSSFTSCCRVLPRSP